MRGTFERKLEEPVEEPTNKQNEKCATPMGHLIVGKQNECIISFVKEPRRRKKEPHARET